MNENLWQAYEFAKEEAKKHVAINPDFLGDLNAMLIRTTVSIHITMNAY